MEEWELVRVGGIDCPKLVVITKPLLEQPNHHHPSSPIIIVSEKPSALRRLLAALCHDEKHNLCCNLGSSNCNSKLQNEDIRRSERYTQQYNSGILHTIYLWSRRGRCDWEGRECPWSLENEEPCFTKVEVYFHSGMGRKSQISKEFSKQKVTWGLGCDFSGVEK